MKQLVLIRLLPLVLLLLGGCLRCSGQEFEVASIKPSPEIGSSNGPVHFGPRGGPGTGSPARYSCDRCDVSELVSQAYDLPEYRLVSTNRLPPDRFDVVATMDPGATRDQFRIMLQNLMVERFALKVHREKREMLSYRLLVARGGAKLKPHVEGAPVQARTTGENAQLGIHFRTHATLAQFAEVIEEHLRKPVVDATGLAGEYDFDLSWCPDDLDRDEQSQSELPTLSSAIRSLGLKLDSHEEQLDVILIDDIARSPTHN